MKKNLVFLILYLFFITQAFAVDRIKLATTTSTENSGLLAVLNPVFESKHPIMIDVIAVGTGKALELGKNGDVDIVLVHDPESEREFVNKGFGVDRLSLMHNDFVLLGPEEDQAGVKQANSLKEAMQLINSSSQVFISRGDESGTHLKEKQLWKLSGIKPVGRRYLSTGQGMGAVLKITDDKLGYTLSDRGTYLAYKDKVDLQIVYEGDPLLFNPYHVIMVNPDRYKHIRADLAQKYIDFIRGREGQAIIRNYKIAGETLFYPDVMP